MDSLKAATGLTANSTASTDSSTSTNTNTDLAAQSGEEPLSGEQGLGTAEEPFDAGNAEGEFCFLHYFYVPFFFSVTFAG